MKSAKNVSEVKEAFISFLNASRFSLDPLKTDFSEVEGFEEWWRGKGTFLESDALCRFFKQLRNDITKAGKDPFGVSHAIKGPVSLSGPLQIGQQGILRGVMERGRQVWKSTSIPNATTTVSLGGTPDEFKDLSLPDLCQSYVDTLTRVVDDFVLKFGGGN